MKLQQETIVREYQRRFEQLSVGLKDMSDVVLESKFVCELKEEIQSEIRKLNTVDLEAKMLMIHGASGNPSLTNKISE